MKKSNFVSVYAYTVSSTQYGGGLLFRLEPLTQKQSASGYYEFIGVTFLAKKFFEDNSIDGDMDFTYIE